MDEGLGWVGHIGQVRARVGRFLGVLGRASAVLGRGSLLSLYNGIVQWPGPPPLAVLSDGVGGLPGL